ncbi:MAG: MBL fold metallo-hydrolase [Candidatus Nanoarchaeia archaeon]
MIVKQFRGGPQKGCLTYILSSKGEAFIVDAVIHPKDNEDSLKPYLEYINKNKLNIKGIIDTHIHADHYTAAEKLREMFKSEFYIPDARKVQSKIGLENAPGSIQSLLKWNAGVKSDKTFKNGEKLYLADEAIEFVSTPGHTKDMTSILFSQGILSGDSLFIGGIARPDLPGGDKNEMYFTLQNFFHNLAEEHILYPGHDYKGNRMSVIGYEKDNNPFMRAKNLEEFLGTVSKSFDEVKEGMSCAANIAESSGELSPIAKSMCLALMDYAKEHAEEYIINSQDLANNLENYFVLDVRSIEEFKKGYIRNATNIPAGPDTFPQALDKGIVPKNKKIVTYCRSGARSALATMYLRARGYNAYSLNGGTNNWEEKGLNLEK